MANTCQLQINQLHINEYKFCVCNQTVVQLIGSINIFLQRQMKARFEFQMDLNLTNCMEDDLFHWKYGLHRARVLTFRIQ